MAEEKPINAVARVRLTVEVTLASPWGPNAPIKDVHRIGARDAVDTLRRIFDKLQGQDRVEVIGDPEVTAVMVTK